MAQDCSGLGRSFLTGEVRPCCYDGLWEWNRRWWCAFHLKVMQGLITTLDGKRTPAGAPKEPARGTVEEDPLMQLLRQVEEWEVA